MREPGVPVGELHAVHSAPTLRNTQRRLSARLLSEPLGEQLLVFNVGKMKKLAAFWLSNNTTELVMLVAVSTPPPASVQSPVASVAVPLLSR